MKIIVIVMLLLPCLVASTCAQGATSSSSPGVRYTLTIYVDQGTNIPSAVAQSSSLHGSNLGHVFVELTSGKKKLYLGYYGDRRNPSRGQLRVDADLARNGYWNIRKTYQITEHGYIAAHKMIDTWETSVGSWKPWCNCGDFAEAVATVAGVRLESLPKNFDLINRPNLWAQYLREHGGIINPRRIADPDLSGTWSATYPGGPLRVQVSQRGQHIVATLIDGNVYIPAGAITFSGKHDGKPFVVSQTCAYEGYRNPTQVSVLITIQNKDHFIETLLSGLCGGFPVMWTRIP